MTVTLRKLFDMIKKWYLYVGFFVLLFGAYFLYYFSQDDFSQSGLPVINNNIQPFSFTNQNGKTLTERDIDGKVYVAEYFFTTCRGICPRLNTNMKKVYERFKDEKDFVILSHTSDPETDSAQQLKKYADSLGVNTSKWMFLTGRKDSLYTMARISYTIDDPANNLRNIDDDFLHTQYLALVNRQGEVKKIYDGLKDSEIRAMIKEIEKTLH